MTAEPAPVRAAPAPGRGVEAEAVDAGYLQKRELKPGPRAGYCWPDSASTRSVR